jgi:hypothetical protein
VGIKYRGVWEGCLRKGIDRLIRGVWIGKENKKKERKIIKKIELTKIFIFSVVSSY